jgi:HEAT repeat protein
MNTFLFILLAALPGAVPRGGGPTMADVPADVSRDVKDLIEKTFSSDAETRAKAAEGLGAMGAAAAPAVPFLVRLLADKAEAPGKESMVNVAIFAEFALVKIGKPAVGPCIEALKDPSTFYQLIGLMGVLGKSDDPRALDALISHINDPNASRSSMAIWELRNCHDPRIVGPLVEALTKGPNAGVRCSAARGLANVRDPRAVDALLAALKSKDAAARDAAVYSLGAQKDHRAVPAILDVLRNAEYDNTRCDAAYSLGQIGDRRALGPLLAVLKDTKESAYLRSRAAVGLGLLGDRDALAPLKAAFEDVGEKECLRAGIIHGIADLDHAAALPLLTKIAKSPQETHTGRFYAALELLRVTDGAIEDPAILPLLDAYYENYDIQTAQLPYRHSLRNIELKKVVAHGKNEAVRSMAAKMLDKSKGAP